MRRSNPNHSHYGWQLLRVRIVFVVACALLVTNSFSAQETTPQSSGLNALLDKTSRQVAAFLDQVSEVRCTETVQQIKLNPAGRPEFMREGSYDYFVLLQGTSQELMLNESRLPLKTAGKLEKNVSLLITNGFSTLFLLFHPYYRSSFRFEQEPDEVVAGQRLAKVRFVHIPGTRTPAALAVRGREFPLELQGTAWIDPASGMIVRITTGIANHMEDVGLRTLVSQIDFAPVQLPGWAQTFRFPVRAVVEVETLRQHWRNIHEFRDYKRFMVGTEQTVNSKVENK